jgi:hypothetical protein
MVAMSTGLTRVHWDEFRRLAPMIPPPTQDYPQGALGLYRGQTVDFILAHAHVDSSGKPGVQYVLLSADVLRQVAGRVSLLQSLTVDAPPTTKTLTPLQLRAPAAPDVDSQVDDLSSFTFMLDDNFAVIEGLLAGLIQGVPLAIINGPGGLAEQLKFVQGLLTLLPVPARFGVTFATYARRLDVAPVQIAFMVTNVPPEGALTYDWQNRTLTNPPTEKDPYSRFIMQQLRLDPTVAVEQMVALTRTAGWRMQRNEPLVQALGWAAKRVALDAAVMEGQPADSEMVAAVLCEDPTLSKELRARYARHLLAFTLALDDPEPAGIIAAQARNDDGVADGVLEMLDDSIGDGKGLLVYRLVEQWIASPEGPEGFTWRRRAYAAASAYLQTLVAAGNIEATIAFLEHLQGAPDNLMIGEAAPELLEIVLPLALRSTELTQMLFLLAADHLPAAPFQRLVRMTDFSQRLPDEFQQALTHFQPGQPTAAPPGMLKQVARAFGEHWELVVLARLVEWVIALERPDLIDMPALERLVALSRSPWCDRFQVLLQHVVQDLGRSNLLALLEPPGPRYLVEIMLLLGDYRQVVGLLERVSKTLYLGDEQVNFAPWVSGVFEHTALDTGMLLTAIETIESLELKPVPLAMACRGALINKRYDPVLEPLTDRLTRNLINDMHLVQLVGYEVALRLVQMHARRQDESNAIGLAAVITSSLAGAPEGLAVMGQLWTLLNWKKDVRESALELLRRYVRQVPRERAAGIPAHLGRKLGHKIEEMLQATILMDVITGSAGLDGYAEAVHIAAELLADLHAAYLKKPYPTLHRLRSDLDSMSGGVSDSERDQIAANLLSIGQVVEKLGSTRGKGRQRADQEQKLIAGQAVPRTAVDALLWIGGYIAEGQARPPDMAREAMQHVLGRRSVNMLLGETTITLALLANLQEAFPPGDPPALNLEAFTQEMRSLWRMLSLYEQRQIQEDFAADAQALAALIGVIADNGDERALTDSGMGRNLETARREPRSELEVLRLLYGYFARKQ